MNINKLYINFAYKRPFTAPKTVPQIANYCRGKTEIMRRMGRLQFIGPNFISLALTLLKHYNFFRHITTETSVNLIKTWENNLFYLL